MNSVWTALGAGITSGAVISALLGMIFARRMASIQNEVKAEFERRTAALGSRDRWAERSLSELFGPMIMQFDRTRRAFGRYTARNLYLEAKVLKEGNATIRDLLLSKGHLIPIALLDAAGQLVEHYDRWLEEFERTRGEQSPDLHAAFVFAGPAGFPFPAAAEASMREEHRRLVQMFTGTRAP